MIKNKCVFGRWEFRTEQHDIQFAVYRSDASGARQTVVEPRRIACQGKGLPEVGIVTCNDAPAKCKKFLFFLWIFPPNLNHMNGINFYI
jgi:hypothetical protein